MRVRVRQPHHTFGPHNIAGKFVMRIRRNRCPLSGTQQDQGFHPL